MADLPPVPIEDITDPDQARVVLWNSLRFGQAPVRALIDAAKVVFDLLYQPLAARLTSWAAVVRAANFDTFVATPSSANFAALLTDESGTDKVAFEAQGTFTPAFSASGSTFSYATQTGNSTKIGRMVFFDITLILNTSGNTLTANALSITGLPFTVNANNALAIFPIRFFLPTTSYVGLYARLAVGTSTLVIEGLTAAATQFTAVNANAGLHATNGTSYRFSGIYFV